MSHVHQVQAEKVSVPVGTPGLGTVTSVATALPITGGTITATGTIGVNDYNIGTRGTVPAPGTNDHSQILWDDGWAAFSPTFPGDVHILGKLTVDGAIDPPAITVENKTQGDSATAPITFTATDTNANTSSVSWGIELPGDGATAGDLVARTGAGVKRLVVHGGTFGGGSIDSNVGIFAITHPDALLSTPDTVTTIQVVGTNSNGGQAGVLASNVISTTDSVACYSEGGTPNLFGVYVNSGGQTLLTDGPYVSPSVGTAVVASAQATNFFNAFLATSEKGISGLFQTSATDGSNSNPTAVFAGNTAQTAPLTEWRGTDGTTVLGSLGVGGGLNLVTGTATADLAYNNLSFNDSGGTAYSSLNISSLLIALDVGVTPIALQASDPATATAQFIGLGDTNANGVVLVVRFSADSTGPMQKWVDQANGLLAQVGYTGDFQTTSLGIAASASIGSGTDGTVALVADTPGVAGNSFTVEVASGAPALNVPLSAVYTGPALLVTLGTDGAGVLDPTLNTATLVAGAINTAAGGLTATASGTGADPLTGAEGPTTLTGGAESVTSAGGFLFNGPSYLRATVGQTAPLFQLQDTAGGEMVAVNSGGTDVSFWVGTTFHIGETSAGVKNGGNFTLSVNDGSDQTGTYAITGSSGLHAWDAGIGVAVKEMTFDANGVLAVPVSVQTPMVVDAAGTGPQLGFTTSGITAVSVGTLQTPFTVNTVVGSSVNKQEWQSDGTPVASVSSTGVFDAVGYSVGGTPGLASFSGAITNLTVVNGIVTAAS